MKLNVKTLRGTNFEIEASPDASVAEVKSIIETTQGQSTYPADQQMLIYQGETLKDESTLESNVIAENSSLFIVMLPKASSSAASTTTASKDPATLAPSAAQPAVAPLVQPSAAEAGPNANPLNLFPQGIPEIVEAPPVARAPAAGQQTNQQALSSAQPAVALPVQPSAASVGPNTKTQYKLARIFFGNGFKYFCCQSFPCISSSGKNCPCAFLAIWNYLILRCGATLESKTGYHSEQDIRHHVATIFSEKFNIQMEAGMLKDLGSDADILRIGAEVLKNILHLQSVEMRPYLSSAEEFVRTVGVHLFSILDIPVRHGHMTDSKKSKEQKVGALTAYGLSCLLEIQEEGELAVLYVDGHFSVILKQERTLFTLETDENVLESQPDAIWKAVTLSEGDSFYLTSRFSPTKNQKNKEKANEWYDQNLKEKFGDSGGSEPLKKKRTRAQRKLSVSVDRANGGNGTADSLGTADSPGDLPMVVNKNGTGPFVDNSGDLITQQFPKADKGGDLTKQFCDFLLLYKDNHTVPYFKGQLEAMKCLGKPLLYVPYEMIERHDRSLAITIRDQPSRIDNDLKKGFVDYMVIEGFDRANVQDTAELHISGLPKPKSTQSLTEFATHNTLRKDYKLFGDIVISTAFEGRRMALGFLCYILSHHEAGLCWNGKFDASHFVVKHNGLQFIVDLDAEENLTKEGAIADLLQYCAIIFPLFEDEHGKYPLYFDHFQKDCLDMPDPKKDLEKWKKFLKMMRCHFALKAPAARSGFLGEIYTLASGRMVAGRPFPLLNTAKVLVEWRRNLRLLEPFKGVYDHNNYYMIDKWGCTYWYLLQFSRHFIQHVLKYLKEKFMYHDVTIIELMLSNQLEKSLADFMWYFVYNCDIDGMFDSAWDHFAASDCMDRTVKDVNEDAMKDCPHIPESNTESNDDVTRLLFTVAAGSSSEFLDILIQAGVDPNMSAGGATPLHIAAESGNTEVIELLHAAGGNTNICNADGLKPIQVAALRKNREAVELLLPLTTLLPSVSDWSFDGICEYTLSKYAGKTQVKEDPSLKSTSLARPHSVEISPILEKKSIEANLRGNRAYEREDYIKAAEAYTEAIDLDSNNATAWSNRSLCWLLIGIAEKALEDAQQCRVLRPDSGKPCYREGAALHELQRFFEAATAFYEGAILEQEKKDYLTAFRVSVEEGMKKFQRRPPEFPGRRHLGLIQL